MDCSVVVRSAKSIPGPQLPLHPRGVAFENRYQYDSHVANERKQLLLRLDPAVHDALARWATDELRSTNAQIEFVLRQALSRAGRLPRDAGEMRRPGRPSKHDS